MEMKNICLGSHAAEWEKFIELEVTYSGYSESYVITSLFRSDWGTWVALSAEDWKEVEGYIYDDGVEDWQLKLCDGDGTADDLILIGQRDGDVYFAVGDIDNVEFFEEED